MFSELGAARIQPLQLKKTNRKVFPSLGLVMLQLAILGTMISLFATLGIIM